MPLPRKQNEAPSSRAIRHEDCWAKTTEDGRPGISVRDHCLNVGCVADALLERLPATLRNALPAGAAALAALHDIGKVSLGFQAKCAAWCARHGISPGLAAVGETDHAKISQYTIQQFVRPGFPNLWAAAIGAHHGSLKGTRIGSLAEADSATWIAERSRLLRELASELGALPSNEATNGEALLLAGLTTVADWIGSDETWFREAGEFSEARRRRVVGALQGMGWQRARLHPSLGFGHLFPRLSEANALQQVTVRHIVQPGVYVIEGPMGCGKTEAALAAAYRLIASGNATGLYFALPTQVTSNRIYRRVRDFLDAAAVDPMECRLAHSGSWLVDDAPPPCLRPAAPSDSEGRAHVQAGRSWFASSKRALLASFGVGTVDQALLGVVAAKHFFVRQFGLAGKVVVLDEVHTYDLYTSTLIDALVARLRELHCTVIILSATLTEARRRELLQAGAARPLSPGYPLLSAGTRPPLEAPCEPPPEKTVTVRFHPSEELVELALQRARRGECVLWIRNTVDEAQTTRNALQTGNQDGGPQIALLHSRFPFFRREQLEDDWMGRLGKEGVRRPREGCVLVSTQVCEQSVDIDADLLITDLAPTDMLLQRLGRLWRHDRLRRLCAGPEVWIAAPVVPNDATAQAIKEAFGKSAFVYAPYVLVRSLHQWRARDRLALPGDIRAILEATYKPLEHEPEGWRELRAELEARKEQLRSRAVAATAVWSLPPLADEEGVQTRWESVRTVQLLLLGGAELIARGAVRLQLLDGREVEVNACDWRIEAARAIHRNCVRIPWWVAQGAVGDRHEWLDNYVQQRAVAGLWCADGEIRWLGREAEQSGLSYHPDEGVKIHRERMKTAGCQPQGDEWNESYD
jgi:CRISPR-associated endonuclease/helicase Cas3